MDSSRTLARHRRALDRTRSAWRRGRLRCPRWPRAWASPTATCGASSRPRTACRRMQYLTDAAPAAGQAAADRHGAARHAGGAGQRLRQPAPLQRRVRRALPAQPDAAAPRTRRAPAPDEGRCGWPTARPTTWTPCWPSSPCARCAASSRSTGLTLRRTLGWTAPRPAPDGWLASALRARAPRGARHPSSSLAPVLGRCCRPCATAWTWTPTRP
jgi:hypothetical protein